MYLTRFEINRARRATRQMLSSLQTMHAAVSASLPSDDADTGRVLWRVDPTATSMWLYLTSPTKPDLTHLAEQIGWPTRLTWQTADYTPLLDRLEIDQRWGFRLTANPTHTAGGRRFAHVTVAQQLQWLLDRAERSGFRIADTAGGDHDLVIADRGVRRFGRQGSTVTLSTATYDGALVITDPEALRHALTGGIGRAKAYGCGLLTLAKQ